MFFFTDKVGQAETALATFHLFFLTNRETVRDRRLMHLESEHGLNFTSDLLLSFNHSFHTVVHILDKLNFRKAKASLVWDVIDMVGRFGVFAVDASDLNLEAVSDGLELLFPLSEVG